MAIENRITSTSGINQEAAFGVTLGTDGSIKTVAIGSFDLGYADRIAAELILLASRIRCAARSVMMNQ